MPSRPSATPRPCHLHCSWHAFSLHASRTCSASTGRTSELMWLDAQHSKWTAPLFAVAAGGLLWAAAALGGHADAGGWMFGIMVLVAVGTLLGSRSETVRGLRGDGRDERFAQIDLRATAYTGLVLTVTIIVAFVYELTQGRSGEPYTLAGRRRRPVLRRLDRAPAGAPVAWCVP